MDLDEIQGFLTEHAETPEVQNFLNGLNVIDAGKVEKFLSEDVEGKKLYSKLTDTHFTKSLDTWKTNNLPTLIKQEVDKGSEKTPAEIKIEELERRIQESEFQAKLKEMEAFTVSKASELGLPSDVALMVMGETDEETTANLQKIQAAFNTLLSQDTRRKYETKDHQPAPSPTEGKGKAPSIADLARKNSLRNR